MPKNMVREDQIKFRELINKKQMWIKRAINEISTNNTNEGYKRAVSFINFDIGTNIEIEKILLKYHNDENSAEPDKVDESTYEDVKVEDEQDNI